MTKYLQLSIVLGIMFFCTGCAANTVTEEQQATFNEDNIDSKEINTVDEVALEEEPDETDQPIEEPPAEEEEFIEEDLNNYGNTMGNIYNEGVYVEYEDDAYITYTRKGQTYIIDEEGNGYYIPGLTAYELSYSNGKLYGIFISEDENIDGLLMVLDMETFAGRRIDRKPEYLYVVDDIVYYSDRESHRLICYNPETEEENLLVDSEVYFPTVYKDVIIFQHDADGESLYSVSLEGGEITKLNDMHSYWPIVYRDKIYYLGVENAAYTLRSMRLDGSNDTELAAVQFRAPVICADKLCFIDAFHQDTVSYLELSNPDAGIQTLDMGDELIDLLKNDEEVISAGTDMTAYELIGVSNLSNINEILMFRTIFSDKDGNTFWDSAMYDFAIGKTELLPMYENSEDLSNNASEAVQSQPESASQTYADNSGHNYYKSLTAEQATAADAIASQIAESIMSDTAYTTDVERVNAAAQLVKSYCDKGVYGADDLKYYRSPYGVFISGNWTCAGATRALGRVLDYMGYSWTHVNENQWAHQWCILTMDGQVGFGEGVAGCARYGDWNDYFWTDGHWFTSQMAL